MVAKPTWAAPYSKVAGCEWCHTSTQSKPYCGNGEWHHIAGFEREQELFDAYGYQLSVMAYAVGLTHFHRLPAARSTFKQLLDQAIHTILLHDVCGYWFSANFSGSYIDPGRTELRVPWAEPIIKQNIMYSGNLLMITSMYAMLFDDDKFEKPGSLTFEWKPQFWGLGKQTFVYDNRSVQAAILKEMERSRWIGVCKPNLIFIVCNQFPISRDLFFQILLHCSIEVT